MVDVKDYIVAARALRLDEGEWTEEDHPRDEAGRFSDGGGVTEISGHAKVVSGNPRISNAVLSGITKKQADYLIKKPIRKLEVTKGSAVVGGDEVEGYYRGGPDDQLTISGKLGYGDPWVPGETFGVSDAARTEEEAAVTVFHHELGHRIITGPDKAAQREEARKAFINSSRRITEYAGNHLWGVFCRKLRSLHDAPR